MSIIWPFGQKTNQGLTRTIDTTDSPALRHDENTQMQQNQGGVRTTSKKEANVSWNALNIHVVSLSGTSKSMINDEIAENRAE